MGLHYLLICPKTLDRKIKIFFDSFLNSFLFLRKQRIFQVYENSLCSDLMKVTESLTEDGAMKR